MALIENSAVYCMVTESGQVLCSQFLITKIANNVVNRLFGGNVWKVGEKYLQVIQDNERNFIDTKFFKFKQ